MYSWRADLRVCILLLLVTAAVYAPVRRFDFVSYDDPQYVQDPHVRGDLVPAIRWAFTSGDQANWFPLTRISHLLDYRLFGQRAGLHHVMNVLIHFTAAVALFLFLRRATGDRWPSASVALLFALHPLHVESVAWVAERKDVLCALFWFLTLLAWQRYVVAPSPARYSLALLFFAMGLMSKPMIVTMPFVLLLIDAWPLQRAWSSKLLVEKIPFLLLAGGDAVITYLAQDAGKAVQSLGTIPPALRIENGLITWAVYIARTVWPARLAVFYPYPASIPAWMAVAAGALLIGVSAFVLRQFGRRPYLAAGWFWYLGTLVPVIGLVQVGMQARADRYMYVPMVGLGIMLAWGSADFLRQRTGAKPLAAALATAICVTLGVVSWFQVRHWANSESLFRHAIDVTRDNYTMYMDLGNAIAEDPARLPEAADSLETAARLKPDSEYAHYNLAVVLMRMPGGENEAVEHLRAAMRIKPDYADAHTNLGTVLLRIPGRTSEALDHFEMAVQLNPGSADTHNNLGVALMRMPGRMEEAVEQLRAAIRVDSNYAPAHANLGDTLLKKGEISAALDEYGAALRIAPDDTYARGQLESVLRSHPEEALRHYEQALKTMPDDSQAHDSLGLLLAAIPGRELDAAAQFEEAVELNPRDAATRVHLASALTKTPGGLPEAIAQLEAALRIRPDPGVRQLLEQLRAASGQ